MSFAYHMSETVWTSATSSSAKISNPCQELKVNLAALIITIINPLLNWRGDFEASSYLEFMVNNVTTYLDGGIMKQSCNGRTPNINMLVRVTYLLLPYVRVTFCPKSCMVTSLVITPREQGT